MTSKYAMRYALALIFACSPAFAADCGKKSGAPCPRTKTGKAKSAAPPRERAPGAGSVEKPAAAVMREVTKEELGKEAVCPVMGETFKVTAQTLSVSYKGDIYYFCCPGCKKPFLENPEKYAEKAPQSRAAVYVCPADGHERDQPGKCPKCGADLVEKK